MQTFVTRYKDEPTILGWELANEPRCTGSTGLVLLVISRNSHINVNPPVFRTSTGTCKTTTITEWVAEMSAFIKSIDSNHLVAIGDEGFFNDPGNPSYPYQCVSPLTTHIGPIC